MAMCVSIRQKNCHPSSLSMMGGMCLLDEQVRVAEAALLDYSSFEPGGLSDEFLSKLPGNLPRSLSGNPTGELQG